MKIIAIRFDPSIGTFLTRKRRLRKFVDTAGTESYVFERFPDRTEKLRRVQAVKEIGKLPSNGSRILIQVKKADLECSLAYGGLKDKNGAELDLTVRGTWRVSD